MKAIIMAGGKGTRLRPLTSELPKPMAPLLGKPCISYIIDLCRKNGIEDIAATVMYEKEKVAAFIRPQNVRIFEEKKPLGTAGSIRNCKSFINGDFCVISGDCLCDFDLAAAVDFHRAHGGLVTVVMSRVSQPLEYGVCVTNSDGEITRFIEKPSWERAYSGTVNTGVYIFSEEILNYIEEGKQLDFSQDIFPLLMRKGIKIFGYEARGYWCDIGSISAYLQCNEDLLAGKVSVQVPKSSSVKGATVIEPSFIGKNVRADGAVIGPYAVIADGCVLESGSRTEYSVLGENVHVGKDTALRRSVVCADTFIGERSSVGDYSVIGAECQIGSDCTVCARTRIYPKNSFPDGSFIRGNILREYKRFTVEQSRAGLDADISAFTRLGAAFGSIFKGNIAIGYEDREITAQTFGIISGILSCGSNALGLGECDRNVMRYIIRAYGLDAGIYVGMDQIYLFEDDGLPLSRKSERAFEAVFENNEFTCQKSGKYRRFKGYLKTYTDKLKKYTINMKPLNMHILAPDFLTQVIPSKADELAQTLYVGDGVTVDSYPQRVIRCAVAIAYGSIYGRVYIPYTFPSVIDELGQLYGFEVIRLTIDDPQRRRLYDMTDPNIMAAALCKYLSKQQLTFDRLAKSLPQFALYSREVECVGDKCFVMQQLSSISDTEKELVEGVRIIDRSGKRNVLIMPKRDLHGFRLIAEATNAEAAAEICDFYVKKMKSQADSVDKNE